MFKNLNLKFPPNLKELINQSAAWRVGVSLYSIVCVVDTGYIILELLRRSSLRTYRQSGSRVNELQWENRNQSVYVFFSFGQYKRLCHVRKYYDDHFSNFKYCMLCTCIIYSFNSSNIKYVESRLKCNSP